MSIEEWSERIEQSEPGSGEHAHELLEWFEWLAGVKFDIHMFDVEEVCGERGEMVWIVPLPRRSLVFMRTLHRRGE